MNRTFALILALITIATTSLSAQYFEGWVSYDADTLSFKIELKEIEGKMQAFYSSDEQKAFGIPCGNTLYEDDKLTFSVYSDFFIYEYQFRTMGKLLEGNLKVYATESEKLLNTFVSQLIRSAPNDTSGYTKVNQQFESNRLKLSGSMWMPKKPNGKGILFVTSSQGSDRKGSNAEALYFVKNGYHVFHYDKRGTGASEGSWWSASIEDLSSDDIAAVRFFAEQSQLDLANIGITGSSQGGIKVPYILSKLPDLGFGISVSCPGGTLLESDLNFWKNQNRNNIVDDFEVASLVQKKALECISGIISYENLQKELKAYEQADWYQYLWLPEANDPKDVKLNFSGLPYFSKVSQPILVIQGLSDEIIPLDSYLIIEEVLKSSGNDQFQMNTLKNTTHSMTYIDNTFPYFQKLNSEYLKVMSTWLDKIFTD